MTSVLYISYDGLLEPLGQSQVVGYLSRLAEDHQIHILSFEKKADRQDVRRVGDMRSQLQDRGIKWTSLAYHKRPSALATAFDVALGIFVGVWIVFQKRIGILHVRSYVPALIALPILRLTGCKLIFDMRGFWADERVDGGLWPRDGWLYRLTKYLETRFLRAAHHIVTLTHASERVLKGFPALRELSTPVTVIPTCADLALFSPPPSGRCLSDDVFVLGYVGSVGTWYMLDETLAVFRAVLRRRPEARLLVVNRTEHAQIREMAARAGIPAGQLELVSAHHHEVPVHVRRMHFGAALIRPSFSKIASAPTKLAEYLGCGVPCLGNVGIGDVAEVLQSRRVGVTMAAFDDAAIEAAAEEMLNFAQDPTLRARCVGIARDLFAIDRGVAAYRTIYQSLATPGVNDEKG
jgi:glycosyltransferase involved in cell wall biosynthesis